MKNYLLLLFLSVTSVTLTVAQTPSKALFKKYENKNGVNLSVSPDVTTMSIDKDDDDRDIGYNGDVDPSAGHTDPSVEVFFSPTDDLTILLLFS